jgi:uncharacterized protein Yka (UPF0111/DUF47 family)
MSSIMQSEGQMIDLLQGKLQEMSSKLKLAIDTASEANEARKVAQMHLERERNKVSELTKMIEEYKHHDHQKELEHRQEMKQLHQRIGEVEKEANNIVNGYLKKREKWTGIIAELEQKVVAQKIQVE